MGGSIVAAVELGGLAAIAEMLDPAVFKETVRNLVSRAREPLLAEGAQVDLSPGHTLLATWHGPEGAMAAVRAALAIVRNIQEASRDAEARHSVRFWTRVGIHESMESVESSPELTAVMALALKGHGRHDTVMITGQVRRHIRAHYQVLPLAPTSLLPDLPPEPTFEVVGPKIAKEAADRAPFVGRQLEGRQLLDLMKLTHHSGPQIVDLVGDAGIGKSRLAHEFCQRVSQRGLGRVLRGNALNDADGMPQALVASLIRSWLGIGSSTLPEEIALRLQSEITPFQLAAPDRIVALLAHLLGVEMPEPDVLSLSPYQKQMAAYMAFDEVVVHMARQAFLLLFLDDLQWADDASVAWLHGLLQALEDSPDSPVLLIASYRPEADRDFGEGFGPTRWNITLDGLNKRECRRLAAGLLGLEAGLETIPEPAARSLLDAAIDRGEGNPLYQSEIIQAMVDRGALYRDQTGWHRGVQLTSFPVAASLQEAVADRLEQLDAVLLLTVQAAAILGRSFSPAVLARMLGVQDAQGVLAELVLADMVTEQDNGEFAFNIPAAQETVYRSLSAQNRKELHGQAAVALEDMQNRSRQRNPAPVAKHFLLSHVPSRAVPYLVGAGERALAANSPTEAVSCFNRALELHPEGNDDVPVGRILLGLADAQALDGRHAEAAAHIEAVLALPGCEVGLFIKLADVHRKAGSPEAARNAYERGLEATAGGSGSTRGLLRAGLAELAFDSGDIMTAEASAREALALLPAGDMPEEASRVLLVLARCAMRSADHSGGVEAFRKALALRQRIRDLPGIAGTMIELGQVLRIQGEWGEAGNVLEQARDTAMSIGDRRQEAGARVALAELCLDQGNSEAGTTLLEEAHEIFLTSSDLASMGMARLRLGEAALINSDLPRADKYVEDGLAIAHALGDTALRVSLHRLAAQVMSRRGKPYGPHMDAAEQMADAAGDAALREEVYRSAAELALDAKDLTKAKIYGRRASQLADERTRPLAAGRTFATWARIYAADGDTDKGDDFDAKAFGIFNRLGAKRDLAALEQET